MITIRLSKADWGKAWRAMIEIAPVRLIADDPVYEVQSAYLELLTARGFTYEVVPSSRRPEKHRSLPAAGLQRRPAYSGVEE
jgi:hypothetical protein